MRFEALAPPGPVPVWALSGMSVKGGQLMPGGQRSGSVDPCRQKKPSGQAVCSSGSHAAARAVVSKLLSPLEPTLPLARARLPASIQGCSQGSSQVTAAASHTALNRPPHPPHWWYCCSTSPQRSRYSRCRWPSRRWGRRSPAPPTSGPRRRSPRARRALHRRGRHGRRMPCHCLPL